MKDQYANYYAVNGINIYQNPLTIDGGLIRAVNVDSTPFGAKTKRMGYSTYLNAVDGSQVNTLFSWQTDSGSLNVYRASGSLLYYSINGTSNWAICGNGTITAGSAVGYSVLNNTLIISQNGGTTRHSTNGTSFTDTTLAPAGGYLEQYHNRIYITGTSSTLTYSVTGDPTNWQTSGTSDSSSITIPGAGLPNKLFKLADRLYISKKSGAMLRWDDFSLVDLATTLGPLSPYSYANVEDNGFWLNSLGEFTSNGGKPQLISNAIQSQIYNVNDTGISGTNLFTAPGVVHNYDYLLAVGSVRDTLTDEPLDKAIIKYDYQKNEFLNWKFYDEPKSWHSFINPAGGRTLIFGNSTGQVFQFNDGNNDNSKPIESIMEFVYHFGVPNLIKEMRWFWGFFNPGCEAQIQIAIGDTYTKGQKNWIDLGDAKNGVVQYRFPTGSRGKLLFLRIKENSTNAPFTYYGCSFGYQIKDPG